VKVLVDDLRNPDIYGADIVFRSAKAFFNKLPKNINTLFLDHDLGLGKTGYDVIVRLVEKMHIYPDNITIVSNNPVGVMSIGLCLKANGYRQTSNRTFIYDPSLKRR